MNMQSITMSEAVEGSLFSCNILLFHLFDKLFKSHLTTTTRYSLYNPLAVLVGSRLVEEICDKDNGSDEAIDSERPVLRQP